MFLTWLGGVLYICLVQEQMGGKRRKVKQGQEALATHIAMPTTDEFLAQSTWLLLARVSAQQHMPDVTANTEHHEEICAVSHLYYNYAEYATAVCGSDNFAMSGNNSCHFHTVFGAASGGELGVMNGKQPDATVYFKHLTARHVGILNGEHKRHGEEGRGQGLIVAYSNLVNLTLLHRADAGVFPEPVTGFVYVEGVRVEAYVLLDETAFASSSSSCRSAASSASKAAMQSKVCGFHSGVEASCLLHVRSRFCVCDVACVGGCVFFALCRKCL